jgi:hypothetical protein
MARKPNLIERLGMALAGNYVREAVGDSIDADDVYYRRITDARRDLSTVATDRAQEISLHLWRSNPMARRIIEMMTDFTVGADGLSIEAGTDKVQEVIDEFWEDPRTHWDLRNRDLVRDLGIYGELAMRKFVNDKSGRMRLGVIDVARIRDVKPDPDDMLVDKTLCLANRLELGTIDEVPLIVYDDLSDPTNPSWVGDAFYFAVNRVIGQHRGTPDLFALADYIDGYDQLLFNAMERTGLINAFVYDVTLEGADDTAIENWKRKYPEAPRPGSVRVHNDKEKWGDVSPALGNADVITIGREVKNMSLGGAGLPEAWFAQGDSANRATLDAQSDPTYRMLQSRQKYVRAMFERMIGVVLYEAQQASRLADSEDLTDFKVNMPDLSSTDTATISSALPQVTTAIVAAMGESLIDRKSARSVFLSVVSQLGIDLDAQEVEDAIEEQKADEAQRAADKIEQARQSMLATTLPADRTDPNDPNASKQPPAKGSSGAQAKPADKGAAAQTPRPKQPVK